MKVRKLKELTLQPGLTIQQAIAILNPCEQPEQCSHQRYRQIDMIGRYHISTQLTVNVGEE